MGSGERRCHGGLFTWEKDMKLGRGEIVASVAFIMIAATIPFAIMDTFQTGRVYLFSREFLDELPKRFTGSGNFRFILQPVVAIILGMYGGLGDARAGKPPYLLGLVFHAKHRRELLRSGFAAISNLLAIGIILDIIFQFVLYRAIHPGAALLVGPILICVPYAISRALTTRLTQMLRKSKE